MESQSLSIQGQTEQGMVSWPPAHEKRGQAFLEEALAFLARFPMATKFTDEDFDNWAEECSYYTVPREAAKDSVEWKGHLQQRRDFKRRLQRASTTPHMRARGGEAYVIVAIPGGSIANRKYEVRTPEAHVEQDVLAVKVHKFVKSTLKASTHVLQGVDLNHLSQIDMLMLNQIDLRNKEMEKRWIAEVRYAQEFQTQQILKIKINQRALKQGNLK